MFTDATIALDYILAQTTDLISKLLVYPDKMLADLNLTGGLIYSPRVLLALVAKTPRRRISLGTEKCDETLAAR